MVAVGGLVNTSSVREGQVAAEFHALVVRQRDAGAAVLMVTHDLFRAREVGTRISLIREGRLVRTMPTAGITASELEALPGGDGRRGDNAATSNQRFLTSRIIIP